MHPSQFDFNSRRSPVLGRTGMAAASQPLAVAAGLKMMQQGGNAADAAVAMAAAMNVTEPCNTGLGGDAFALYYQASTRQVFALNGSGRAPAALTLQRLQHEGFTDQLPPYHAYTVTVPGACAAWYDLVARFGRLQLETIFAPAIELARKGFPVAPLTSLAWQSAAPHQLANAVNGLEMTLDGRGPAAGELFSNPGLAQALDVIAHEGKEGFYRGSIGRAIVEAVTRAGGCLSLDDLAEHESTWMEPISTTYRGLRFWECPPNGQGLAALLALNLLEGFDLQSQELLSVERLHLEIEAMRLAFADARRYVADPTFFSAPLADLLSKEYASQRRKQIHPLRANPEVHFGEPFAASDTVYFSVVDGEGNACSFINSNYMGFGTGIVPHGWGFTLQNRGHNFSLNPQHPNALAPHKRPYHTIIPAMITRMDDNSLFASYGVMGGFMQPQGHMQVAVALVDDQLNPQEALNLPRFCIEPDTVYSEVAIEDGIDFKTLARLSEMGHRVRPVSGIKRSLFGTGQIILRDPTHGVLWGGSDPRHDGCAMSMG